MPSIPRFLLASSSAEFPAANPPINLTMDSDVVVVLASLLGALVAVLGLAFVARCAWLRRYPSPPLSPPTYDRGVTKKVLSSLPKQSFDAVAAAEGAKQTDCVICLSEFEDGELMRVLPHCGHMFHVPCIDTWLGAHSSCPSCRRVLAVPAPSACRKCGASPVSAAADVNCGGDSSFLP